MYQAQKVPHMKSSARRLRRAKKKTTVNGKSLHELHRDIPALVIHLQVCAKYGIPVGASLLEEAIEKHPEHFQKEIQYRQIMKSIPESVHEAYRKDMSVLFNAGKDHPYAGRGMIWNIEHPEEYAEYEAYREAELKRLNLSEIKIWNKHFTKYGLRK